MNATTHHVPTDFSDRLAFGLVKAMRLFADAFFTRGYGHRAVVLETVAAVPGMVGGMLQHLKCLRRMALTTAGSTLCSTRRRLSACIS
jgi:ubiquinol oxidase